MASQIVLFLLLPSLASQIVLFLLFLLPDLPLLFLLLFLLPSLASQILLLLTVITTSGARYCGQIPHGIVTSTSNLLTVEFYTNGSTVYLNYASASYAARSSSSGQ